MDNFWDRAAVGLRPVVALVAIVAVPVFFFSYIAMLREALLDWPLWLAVVVGPAHIVSWIAFSMLHDWQRERRHRQG